MWDLSVFTVVTFWPIGPFGTMWCKQYYYASVMVLKAYARAGKITEVVARRPLPDLTAVFTRARQACIMCASSLNRLNPCFPHCLASPLIAGAVQSVQTSLRRRTETLPTDEEQASALVSYCLANLLPESQDARSQIVSPFWPSISGTCVTCVFAKTKPCHVWIARSERYKLTHLFGEEVLLTSSRVPQMLFQRIS